MTNLQKTNELLGLSTVDECPPELQNLVLHARASITGASDPMPTEELHKVKEALDYRVKNWRHSSDVIDNAILIMCIEGIRLIRTEILERVNP